MEAKTEQKEKHWLQSGHQETEQEKMSIKSLSLSPRFPSPRVEPRAVGTLSKRAVIHLHPQLTSASFSKDQSREFFTTMTQADQDPPF